MCNNAEQFLSHKNSTVVTKVFLPLWHGLRRYLADSENFRVRRQICIWQTYIVSWLKGLLVRLKTWHLFCNGATPILTDTWDPGKALVIEHGS